MRRSIALVAVAVAALVPIACGAPAADTAENEDAPAIVEPIDGSDGLHTIRLTERAAERLGIEATEVVSNGTADARTRIPYSSVIYDAQGGAWAYVVPEAHVFMREALTIEEIVADETGDYAVLGAGPMAGTMVVTVGVAELFGAEFEVGH